MKKFLLVLVLLASVGCTRVRPTPAVEERPNATTESTPNAAFTVPQPGPKLEPKPEVQPGPKAESKPEKAEPVRIVVLPLVLPIPVTRVEERVVTKVLPVLVPVPV